MLKKTIFIALILSCSLGHAQKKEVYYSYNGEILNQTDKASAIIKTSIKAGKRKVRMQTYSLNNQIWDYSHSENLIFRKSGKVVIRSYTDTFFPRTFTREYILQEDGKYFFREYKGKILKRTGYTSSKYPLILEGEIIKYYDTDKLASKSIYKNNQLISNQNWNEDGSEYYSDIFYSVDSPPKYQFGQEAFKNYFLNKMAEEQYPIHEIHDDIVLGAVITSSGELKGVRILKGKVESLNEFLASVLGNLPGDWKPASLNGTTVNYFITIPFNFSRDVPMVQHVDINQGSGSIIIDN